MVSRKTAILHNYVVHMIVEMFSFINELYEDLYIEGSMDKKRPRQRYIKPVQEDVKTKN